MAEKKFNTVGGLSVGSPGNVIDVIDNFANVYANRIFVTQYSNLGDIANVYIGGGTNNQVLKTDGAGGLYWGLDTAPAGGNTAEVQFNDGGSLAGSSTFSFDKVTNLLTLSGNISTDNAQLGNLASANYFSGNGSLITYITGANVTGAVATATNAVNVTANAQPNITSVGSLTSTTFVSNANVTLSGTLSRITGANVVSATYLTGTLTTSAQPNITSLGTLSSLSVAANVTSGNASLGNLATANYFSGDGSLLTGVINNANYAAYAGNITIASQPNITSLGTLASVSVTGITTATGGIKTENIQDLSGSDTIKLKYNTNAGDVGVVANLTVGSSGTGNLKVNGISDLGPVGNVKITGGFDNAVLTTNGAGVLSWETPNYANYAGTVTSAAQPNITSLGTLSSLSAGDTTITGNLTVNGTTSNLSVSSLVVQDNMIDIGAETVGTPSQNSGFRVIRGDDPSLQFRWNESAANWQYTNDGFNYLNLVGKDSAGNVTVGNLTATNLTGTLTTAVQPNITSVGTLASLSVTANVSAGNLTATNHVSGTTLGGTLTTAAQPNITSVGTLVNTTMGSSNSLTGGNLVSANYLTGTLTTAAQPNVTSVGTLASTTLAANATLTLSGAASQITGSNLISANYFTGTLTTAAQPNITSVGLLADANVNGNVLIGGNLVVNGTTTYVNVDTLAIEDPIIELGGGPNNAPLSTDDNKDRGSLLHYYTTKPVDAFMGWDNSNNEFGFGSNVSVSGEIVTWNEYGNIRANYFLGSGEFLTGTIAHANYAAYAGNVTIAAQPNITSVGSLASLTVTGLTTATGGVKTANIIDTSGTITLQTKYNGVSGDIGVVGNIVAGTGGTGNVTATYFVGNGAALSHITAANVTGQVANALIAGTVYTNAQPNITSVGILNGVTATGTVNLTGSGNISLGSNANVHILGGTTGQVLKTDGSGNLYWALDGALPGGSNSQLQFNDGGAFNGVPGLTFDKFTNTLSIIGNVETGDGASGNITGANYVVANYFVGDGSLLTGITTSSYSNANVASYLPTYTGNFTAGNANVTGNITAAFFIGNGSQLTGLPASYANANVAAYLPTYTGNFTAGNANVTGNVTASFFIGNGSQLTGLPASYSNVNVAAYLPTYTGNFTAGNANVSGSITAGNANVAGTIIAGTGSGGSITGANLVSANFFTGNGTFLSSISAANISGQVANALIAATVTSNAQPNITSVGVLSALNVSGNAIITGNLIVSGTAEYTNVNNLYIQDPIIELGGNSNAGALTANDGKDRGTLLHYYTTKTVDAFMGWDNSNGEFAFGSNVSTSSDVVTFNTFGNVRASYFLGNASQLVGTIANANFAAYAGVVTTAAQPNITSVGTLVNTTMGSSNSLTGGNLVSATYLTGTLTTAAQPNITSVGTLASLSVTANVSAGNILTNNLLYANGVVWNFGSTYSNSNAAAYLPTYTGNFTAGNVNVTGNITSAYFIGNGSQLTGLPASYANSNVAAYLPTYTGNFTAGNANVSGNVTASYFIGNGSALTSISGGNVTGQVANALIAGTVYTNAQPNITSVGTLSNLTVTGNATVNGTVLANALVGTSSANVTITAGTYVSKFDEFGTVTLANNLSVPGNITSNNANLGNAVTANFFVGDGSLLTGLAATYSNTNVADYLPTYTGNFTAGNANVTGNVTASFFIGNGSQLTGLPASYANANVAAYLPTYTGNFTAGNANVTGNITASFFIGNGSQLTGLPASYANANVAAYLPTYTGDFSVGNISATGNVTATYIIGNGSQLTGLPASYANANVAAYLPTYTGNFTAGNANVTGNVTASFFIGNGSQLTGLPASYANANVAAYLPTYTGNVAASYFIGNGATLTNIAGGNVDGQVSNSLIAGTVYTNAQPNITSVGTLSALTVDGLSDLGPIENITITGGDPGQVLRTNGSGGLSWVDQTGGGSLSGFVSMTKDRYLTTGSANTFSLSTTPSSKNFIEVVIDGLQQISNTYSLTGSVLSFPTNPASGQVIEVTSFGAVDLTGNVGEVAFNSGNALGASSAFTFTTGTNTLSVGNLTVTGNLTSQGGYVYVDAGIIAVASGNAGVFNTGIANINLGLAANVTIGSTTGNTTIRGNLSANNASLTNLSVNNYYSSRDAVTVTTDTIIDQFPISSYRSAKYTMRVNSDDGYQAVEVLLVHNGSSSYVTIYGSISSSGSDIITMSSNIGSGNIRLFASTASTNTNVKILGTYVPD